MFFPMSAAPTNLPAPSPLAPVNGKLKPVDWMLAFKFNSASFPGCDNGVQPTAGKPGIFGGTFIDYTSKDTVKAGVRKAGHKEGHSQQYVFASSETPTLAKGTGCLGATLTDPLGATFGQIYQTPGYFFVVWNDQLNGHPIASKSGPAGHSKGMAAWNAAQDRED